MRLLSSGQRAAGKCKGRWGLFRPLVGMSRAWTPSLAIGARETSTAGKGPTLTSNPPVVLHLSSHKDGDLADLLEGTRVSAAPVAPGSFLPHF